MPVSPERLMDAARQASMNAHAPYSRFRVGAAVESDDGRIFVGANVENASYGLTVCAERVAILTAVASGATRITRLAVSTEREPNDQCEAMPCGACRQVMAEFMRGDASVHIDHVGDRTLNELLPAAFRLSDDRGPPEH